MIRRLLAAGRGEAAHRVIATCRLLGIETVAVYSDPDAGLPHVADADWAVHLPGSAPTATYLRGDLLIAAARRAGADAVHPGWGFLSADHDFAAAVADAGLTWVGPPAKTLALLADQRAVTARLAEAGLPVLPRYDDPYQVDDFPVLVRSRGGGNRGSRPAHDTDELAEAVAAARREAAAAYGDGAVYCEQYRSPARRLAVSVVRDRHGNSVSFVERECSIHRHHQPLLVESPSPAVSPELRERLVAAATDAATALGCLGAAVAEFLLEPDGTPVLRNLTARLPADHAVTECVVGLDLVRLQLLVAEGMPLPFTGTPPFRGHAIGVRLRAEDPADAWRPGTGTLHRFGIGPVAGRYKPLPAPGLRLDSAATDGDPVTGQYGSALATLVGWAPSRYEAARLLALSLARSPVHGVATNRDLLVRTLRNTGFLAGTVDTDFLAEHPEVFVPLLSSVDGGRLSCLAAALAAESQRRRAATVLASLPSGWRNVPSGAQTAVYAGPMGTVEIGYRLDRTGALASWWVRAVEPDELDLAGLGQPDRVPEDHPPVAIVSTTPHQVVLDVDGSRLTFAIHRVGDLSYVDSAEGSVVLTEVPRWPVPVAVEDDSP